MLLAVALPAAQAPLWELGSATGLLAPAWQSVINGGTGSVTAADQTWTLSSTGSYTGVQIGVGIATPPLEPADRLALSLRRGTGHSSATVRVIFISSDWARQSAYDFPVAAASLSGSVFGLVDATSAVGSPVSTAGGGIVWGTDSLGAIQFIDQTPGGTPVMNLVLQTVVANTPAATLGRPLIDCGNTSPRVTPSSVATINGGSLTVTPDTWRVTGAAINQGAQFALSGSAAVALSGRTNTETLVLRVRPAPGQTMQALDVEFLNAAWTRSSTYRFSLVGLPSGRYSEVAATTTLGGPLATTGGGLLIGTDTIGAMKLYGAVGGATLDVAIERFSTTDAHRFADWQAVRRARGLSDGDELGLYRQGADPDAPEQAAAAGVPQVIDNRLRLQFSRDPRRADLRLVVEASGDLGTWTPIARSVGGAPFAPAGSPLIQDNASGAPATVTVADAEVLGPQSRRFMRVNATTTTGGLLGGEERIDALHHNLGEVAAGRLYAAENAGLPLLPAPAFPTEASWVPAAWQSGSATQTGVIDPRHPHIKYTGRVKGSSGSNNVEFTWSSTQFEARFTGSSLKMDVQGFDHYFNIVLNGDYRNMRTVRVKDRQTVSLAENLTGGPHDILVLHRTSVTRGVARFYGFILDDGQGLVPPAPRPSRRIEFVGDSISAGQVVGMREGFEGSENGEHHDKDNSFLSFTALTARALGAEAHFIAWPGIAMGPNRGYVWTGNLTPNRQIDMPSAWVKAVPNTWNFDSYTNWDFTQWRPQAVVVNLFQNDMTAGGTDTGNLSRDAYVNFLKEVRLKYGGGVQIFAVAGNMSVSQSTAWKQAITDAVNIFKADTGHAAVETLFFPYKGTGGHPRFSEQQAMADLLVPVIKDRLGW